MLDLSHSGFSLLHDTLLINLFLVYDLVHLPNPTSSFWRRCRGLLIFLTKQFKLLICNYFYCFNYWFILTKKKRRGIVSIIIITIIIIIYGYSKNGASWIFMFIIVSGIESWMDSKGLIIYFNSIINHFIFCYLLFIATKSNCLGQPINLIHPLF